MSLNLQNFMKQTELWQEFFAAAEHIKQFVAPVENMVKEINAINEFF